ncbi:MAG: FAD-binding oxidoreductase [Microbacterium sp.]|uniref:FAD-binding oxidoreductase n=1 Tax=Microbacterium sp. TaxID=51671 RepID=UPI0039E4A57E
MTDNALDAFAAIVGEVNVVRAEDERIGAYADPFAFDDNHAGPARGAVLPASVDEVQSIVRAAGRLGVSLWTVSRGRNLGYGGAVPRDTASIVLDLQRMNRVLEVDVERGFVVVEPGVSFFQLYEHLREQDVPLMISVPDLGGGSVIGNALERGFGYTVNGQHAELLCGLEVVMPDGTLVRTGMGAIGGATTAHVYKPGYGPALDGLLFQSNLGVVVGAGVWVLPRPDEIASVTVSAADRSRLGDLVDTLRPLMLDRTIDGVVIAGNVLAAASGIMPRAAIHPDPGPIPDAVVLALAERLGLGWWNAKFGLYGPPAVVDAKLGVIGDAVGRAGLAMTVRRYPGSVDAGDVHPADRAQLGIPSGDLIQMAAWRGGTPAHTDFSVVCSTTGADAQRLVDLVRHRVEAEGLDHVGGFTMFGRHAIMLNLVSFDASSTEEREMVVRLFRDLIAAAAAEGFSPYRAHPAFMDRIAGLADPALRRAVQTVKDALDPAGILSPGKQGVWPSGRG